VKTLLAAISACALFASCSTLKVTPTVADRIARREPRTVIEHDITDASSAVSKARDHAVDAGKELIQKAAPTGQRNTEDPGQVLAQARTLVKTTDEAALVAAADFRVADLSLETEVSRLEQLVRDREMLQQVTSGNYGYTVDESLYFSIEPAVAIKRHINAVAVPSLGINYRPFPAGKPWSAWALQLLLGGALNPSDDAEDDPTGAVGLGFSYPIGDSGAFSFGALGWDDDGKSRVSPYISVTLGSFAKKSS